MNTNDEQVVPDPLPLGKFQYNQNCPNCHEPFDGWDCLDCGYSLPQKHRKAHGKQLTPDEADKVRKHIENGQWPIKLE